MSDMYKQIGEIMDKINDILKDYGLMIDSMVGEFKNPITMDIHIEEYVEEIDVRVT